MELGYQGDWYLAICQSQPSDKPRPFDKPGDNTDDGRYEKENGGNLGDRFSLHNFLLISTPVYRNTYRGTQVPESG